MSLFGTSPPGDAAHARGRSSLFEDGDENEPVPNQAKADSLFVEDDLSTGSPSPWIMSTPRKQQSPADMVRTLLPATNVPDSYVDAFDNVVREDGVSGRIRPSGVARTLNAANLSPEDQARIMDVVAPKGATSFCRGEFNVLLALIGLAQRGEDISMNSVDERRHKLPEPHLNFLSPNNTPSASSAFSIPARAELAAKPSQRPITPPKSHKSPPTSSSKSASGPSMDYSHNDADPWSAPDLHHGHPHAVNNPVAAHITPTSKPDDTSPQTARPALIPLPDSVDGSNPPYLQNNNHLTQSSIQPPVRTASDLTSASNFTAVTSNSNEAAQHQNGNIMPNNGGGANTGWGGYYDGGFGDGSADPNPFGAPSGGTGADRERDREPSGNPSVPSSTRMIGSGRNGAAIEEHVIVGLLPEKEGMFFFQHHNYEISSVRRGSKVIRRYSDFVWLLDCLHKRYPFRALPLLPPKRVALNGNHLSNDGAFIEKRRRGLARFLNAVVRHPVLREEQLVIMFLTVPTELAVWRKQATISVQNEFQGRELGPGLEDSLPPSLEDLFSRTRTGVSRSAELYIGVCNVMDRLVKRSEGVAADHARMALSLISLTEMSNETYATDTNDVPLLNDGLVSMAKHLRTTQSLMEDESRAWDVGVLEDLKRQRDALVSVRDMFDRRERHDRDNIPHLERRIGKNEGKLADLRSKPEGIIKPGEVEKIAQAIVADKQSIVDQHNRSVFVRECIRDELIYFQTTQHHVSRWNQDWAQERVKYAEMLADNWRRLLDELEGMPLGN